MESSVEKLERLISESSWFHAIDFGHGKVSGGRFSKKRPSNYTLFPVFRMLERLSVEECDCLDVGTMDGITAFTLKQMGAARVVATDLASRETFIAAREQLDLDIEYKCPVMLDELPAEIGEDSLDLIVCAGVLYHLLDPLGALVTLRNLLRTDGYLILETQYLHNEDAAVISFSPSDLKRGNIHANTFFRPSYRAICGMIEVAGFKIISTIAANGRLAICAQAKKPSQLIASTETIKNIHSQYLKYSNYRERVNYSCLETRTSRGSVKINPRLHGDYFVWCSRFSSLNPLQPPSMIDRSQFINLWVKDVLFKFRTCMARRRWIKEI